MAQLLGSKIPFRDLFESNSFKLDLTLTKILTLPPFQHYQNTN
ncbi:unknown protein [Simkania negevensis Z]|uniref:Uncharacterized protein n=1 Tax=Simkania negevensis (strain ATCC VR-1471 / DSM 27360 / Z) TaxID=331113 RepID=F8L4Y6_SIMNZ|nr:unknown protein [Simkania negevensis Z]